MNREQQRLVRRIYRTLVPAPVRRKVRRVAKAAVGGAYLVGQLINATLPEYSDEWKLGVGVVLTVLGILGIYKAENRD